MSSITEKLRRVRQGLPADPDEERAINESKESERQRKIQEENERKLAEGKQRLEYQQREEREKALIDQAVRESGLSDMLKELEIGSGLATHKEYGYYSRSGNQQACNIIVGERKTYRKGGWVLQHSYSEYGDTHYYLKPKKKWEPLIEKEVIVGASILVDPSGTITLAERYVPIDYILIHKGYEYRHIGDINYKFTPSFTKEKGYADLDTMLVEAINEGITKGFPEHVLRERTIQENPGLFSRS